MEVDSISDVKPVLPTISGIARSQTQCCILDNLLCTTTSFKTLSFQEKKAIIQNGRPTPDISMSTNMKNYVRHFKVEYYETSKWLTACKSKHKLFCWPCVLFAPDAVVWNSTGFSDISNFHKAKIRHEKAQSHFFAITKLKTFGKTGKACQLNEQYSSDVSRHNAEAESNREIMKRLIDIICLLSTQELPLRAHEEDIESLNRENYIEFLQLLSKYDNKLDSHLQSAKSFNITSNQIQADIIESISAVTIEVIEKEVKESPFVALMMHQTTDLAKSSQLCTVIRYVKDGVIQERFLGFTNIGSNHSPVELSEHVFKILSEFQCEHKLIAHGFDGTATFSGHLNELQELVKQKCSSAFFIHFYAHPLNLVLIQSMQFIKECKTFFKTLSGICSFFSRSTKRGNPLVGSEFKKMFQTVSYNSGIVNAVYSNKAELISYFEQIVDDPEGWDSETFIYARGYLKSLKDFTFSFLLEIFNHIFTLTDALFKILKTNIFELNYCIQKLKDTICSIQEFRNNADEMYAKLQKTDTNESIKHRQKMDDHKMIYLSLYKEIIDTLVSQIQTRFRYLEGLSFIELIDSNKFELFKIRFPEAMFKSLKTAFKDVFRFENLRSELVAIYRLSDFADKKVTEFAKFLKDNELGKEGFPEVYKLCCLICTIPVSTSSEDCVCLNRIKSYVQNTRCEDRLSKLSLLWIEKALLNKIVRERHFYDDVIGKVAKRQENNIPLMFK